MANISSSPSTTKIVLCIVFLVIFAPVGVFMMFKWMKWPAWVKGILTLAGIYFTIIQISMVSTIILNLSDPYGKIFKAQQAACTDQCQNSSNATICMQECLDKLRNPE